MNEQAVFLLTGIQAAGKSTVAQALAERIPRSVHVRGDLFRRLIVNGRADMTPEAEDEAVRQLELRYRLAATVTDAYFKDGFTVVVQDVILGQYLPQMVQAIRARPLLVVVLSPSPKVVMAREAGRGKSAYDSWSVEGLHHLLRHETPHLGLWLDTSAQTPEETVDEILARAWSEAAVT